MVWGKENLALKKILKKDFEDIHNEPIENFYVSIKSDATKERYTRILRNYLMETLSDLIEGDNEPFFVKSETENNKNDLIIFINLNLTTNQTIQNELF